MAGTFSQFIAIGKKICTHHLRYRFCRIQFCLRGCSQETGTFQRSSTDTRRNRDAQAKFATKRQGAWVCDCSDFFEETVSLEAPLTLNKPYKSSFQAPDRDRVCVYRQRKVENSKAWLTIMNVWHMESAGVDASVVCGLTGTTYTMAYVIVNPLFLMLPLE